MKVCFTSYRPFTDGPVERPILESDPANIAYVLDGEYVSFYSLKKLTDRQLVEKFQPFDLVIVALDAEAIELVRRIVEACKGRVATYSEGHIADYQRLSPAGQISYLRAIRLASINFLYWEKYVSFFRALTIAPVEYLPYPFLLDEARRYRIPFDRRPPRAAVPTGLAGLTRNGLASLTVAKRLLDEGVIDEIACWLDADTYEEDTRAICFLLFSTPFASRTPATAFNWRKWLSASHVDYRRLLRLKARFWPSAFKTSVSAAVRIGNAFLFRRGGWPSYLEQMAYARIVIDLNNRETVGRNALDCAVLGIPCVSTDRSDLVPKIFPEITLPDPWDIEAATQMCKHILSDHAYYQHIISKAAAAVQKYDVDHFRQRFYALTAKYRIAS